MVFEEALAVTFWKPAAATKNEASALLSVQYSETRTNPLNPTPCWAHMQLLLCSGAKGTWDGWSQPWCWGSASLSAHMKEILPGEERKHKHAHSPGCSAAVLLPFAMEVLGRSCRTAQHHGSHQGCSGLGEKGPVTGAKGFSASPWKSCLHFTLQKMYNSTDYLQGDSAWALLCKHGLSSL